jgi:hypothetical protein
MIRLSENEVKPFTVFISSSQKEFGQFRKDLKARIDSERFVDQRIARGVLVEEERGASITEDIARGIDNCSIYVGIFGREKSDWTFRELREARARGLPMLVYQLRRHRKRGRPKKGERRGRKSSVQHFLENEARLSDIRIRGPFATMDELEKAIMNDLAVQVAVMVEEAGTVRKTIHRKMSPP